MISRHHQLTSILIAILIINIALGANYTDPDDVREVTRSCMNETGLTFKMLNEYKAGEDKPSDEILCFAKCTLEKYGYVTENRTLCLDAMIDDDFPGGISDEEKNKVYECLESVEEIATCDDMLPLEECLA